MTGLPDLYYNITVGLNSKARDAFRDHVGKVLSISELNGGWESWAQVEIGYACQNTVGVEYWREESMYVPTKGAGGRKVSQRCDFSIRWNPRAGGLSDGSTFTFVELKCLSQRKVTEFIGKVRKDIEKVRNAKVKPEYWQEFDYVQGIVMALTVDEEQSGEPWARMQALGAEEGIEWATTTIGGDRDQRLIAWSWVKPFQRN